MPDNTGNRRRGDSEEHLELILRHSRSVLYNYVFADATWSFISESMMQAIGVSAADYINGGVEKAVEYLHPDDREALDVHLQHILENRLEENHTPNIEYRMKHQVTGEWRWFSDHRKVMFDGDGSPISLFGDSRDITELRNAIDKIKRSEQKQHDMISNISDVIGILDGENVVGYVSPNIKKKFGWEIGDLLGKSFFDFVHEDDLPAIDGLLAELRRDAGEALTAEFRCRHKDESYLPVEMVAVNQLHNESISGILVNYRDISERKRSEAAAIQAQRLSAIGELVAGTAHDFNNALQGIMGYIDVLIGKGLPPDVAATLDVMKKSTVDAAARVNLLQRFAGISDEEIEHVRVNLNHIASDSIAQSRILWKDGAEREGLVIEVDRDFAESPYIRGNPGELRTVLYNIIKNSVQALPAGGTISLKTREDGQFVYLTVIDDGVGMSEEAREKIFEPFFTTKGYEQGTGLGMAGAYSIVKAHQGDIRVVDSREARGTTIEIVFPSAGDEQGAARGDEHLPMPRSARILWVDDNAHVRDIAKLQLQYMGHEADVAASGREALHYLKKGEYELVFTDVGMPEMSGWQLAAKIKELYQDKIKIAIVTGWSAQIGEREKSDYGIEYVLGKPFTERQLELLIVEMLNA